MTVRIDAHQHVWNRQRARYGWLTPDAGALYRDFGMADVATERTAAGVDGVILVQAADNAADTANMLAEADQDPAVVGIVGWVPLDDADTAAEALEHLRADDRVVGVRNLIHEREDPRWILRPEVRIGLEMLEVSGLAFDFVTADAAALCLIPELSERHPSLRIVIDHLGKPPLGPGLEGWRRALEGAAQNPLVHAKVSGLLTSAGAPTLHDVRAVVETALDVLGPQRLMIGSDWPIALLAADYGTTWAALDSALAGLTPEDRDAVLGGTAAAFYRIDNGRIARLKEKK